MPRAKKARILVIEDDALVRRMLTAYFETTPYDTLVAANGQRGLELFRENRPELVLTDLRMPGIDGFAVLDALREESPSTPVVVFSGSGEEEMASEAMRRGAVDYIEKPVRDFALLESVLERALARATEVDSH